jgi:hypothetical protein
MPMAEPPNPGKLGRGLNEREMFFNKRGTQGTVVNIRLPAEN